MRKVLNFLAGFFVGGLTGAAVALLLAPNSGPEMQSQIRSRFEALLEEGKKAASDRRAELENQLEAFKTGDPLDIESTTSRS